MPIESNVVTADDLNAAWPLDEDGAKFGAVHIRNVKKVAQDTANKKAPRTLSANTSNSEGGNGHTHSISSSTSVSSTSTSTLATSSAVKSAYDRGSSALTRASTQVGGGAISGVYYNEAVTTLGGHFSGSNHVRVIRVGNLVTISTISDISHAGSTLPRDSANGAIPTWARGRGEVCYESVGALRHVSVNKLGRVRTIYRTYDGNTTNSITSTGHFTLTYQYDPPD